jgi:hypothetical protein
MFQMFMMILMLQRNIKNYTVYLIDDTRELAVIGITPNELQELALARHHESLVNAYFDPSIYMAFSSTLHNASTVEDPKTTILTLRYVGYYLIVGDPLTQST